MYIESHSVSGSCRCYLCVSSYVLQPGTPCLGAQGFTIAPTSPFLLSSEHHSTAALPHICIWPSSLPSAFAYINSCILMAI